MAQLDGLNLSGALRCWALTGGQLPKTEVATLLEVVETLRGWDVPRRTAYRWANAWFSLAGNVSPAAVKEPQLRRLILRASGLLPL